VVRFGKPSRHRRLATTPLAGRAHGSPVRRHLVRTEGSGRFELCLPPRRFLPTRWSASTSAIDRRGRPIPAGSRCWSGRGRRPHPREESSPPARRALLGRHAALEDTVERISGRSHAIHAFVLASTPWRESRSDVGDVSPRARKPRSGPAGGTDRGLTPARVGTPSDSPRLLTRRSGLVITGSFPAMMGSDVPDRPGLLVDRTRGAARARLPRPHSGLSLSSA